VNLIPEIRYKVFQPSENRKNNNGQLCKLLRDGSLIIGSDRILPDDIPEATKGMKVILDIEYYEQAHRTALARLKKEIKMIRREHEKNIRGIEVK